MHDMGVVFDFHHLGDIHRAWQADPPDVVAAEIHQHGVFGAFFFVGQEFRRQTGVICWVLASGACARYGAGEYLTVLQFDEHFR